MRHTTKMLLIPEDVYKALIAGSKSPSASSLMSSRDNVFTNAVNDGTEQALADSKLKLREIARNKQANPDARHITYMQEFKRYKKYKDDIAKKPINVHVENMAQTAAAIMPENDKSKQKHTVSANILNDQLNDFNDFNEPIIDARENYANERQRLDENPQEFNINKNRNGNKKQPRKQLIASPNKIQLRKNIKYRYGFSPYQNKPRSQVKFNTIKGNKKATSSVAVDNTLPQQPQQQQQPQQKNQRQPVFKPAIWQ